MRLGWIFDGVLIVFVCYFDLAVMSGADSWYMLKPWGPIRCINPMFPHGIGEAETLLYSILSSPR